MEFMTNPPTAKDSELNLLPTKEFMANPSTIKDFELNLLRLTAMFVARNGRDFLLKLMTRESNNSLFDFMKPQHHSFPYFTNLVEQYTKIIVPAKTVIQDLEKSTDYDALLEGVKYRSAWEKHQGDMKEREAKAAEEELRAYKLIDWHDFVIVNTIELDD